MKSIRIRSLLWMFSLITGVLLTVFLFVGLKIWEGETLPWKQLLGFVVLFTGGILGITWLVLSYWVTPSLQALHALVQNQCLGTSRQPFDARSIRIRELNEFADIIQMHTLSCEELTKAGNELLNLGLSRKGGESSDAINPKMTFQRFLEILTAIEQHIDVLSKGDLIRPIPETLQGTTLGDALTYMTTTLQTSISNIGEEVTSISVVSADVAAMSQQSSRNATVETQAIEHISSSSQQVVDNLREVMQNITLQGESLDQTFTDIGGILNSIDEMNSSIESLSAAAEATSLSIAAIHTFMKEIDEHAHSLANISETVSTEASDGGTAVDEVIEGIQTIKHTVEDAALTIHRLGEKSDLIGEVLGVINGIADQTNLLALNASIIAAQAGEHGRGFSVVAGEIKELAERTRSSTQEIEKIIHALQMEVAHGGLAMDECLKAVKDGVTLANHSGGILRKIVQSIQGASQMAIMLAEATVKQTDHSQQLNSATEQMEQKLKYLYTIAINQAKDSANLAQTTNVLKEITQQMTQSATAQLRESESIASAIIRIRELMHRNAFIAHQLASSSEKLGELEGVIAEYMGQFLVTVPQLPDDFDPKQPAVVLLCPNAPYFYQHLYRGIVQAASEKQLQTVMMEARDSRILQPQQVNWLIQQSWLKGIVLVPIDEYVGKHIVQNCLAHRVPISVTDRSTSNAPVCVLSDNVQGGEFAAELLWETLPAEATIIVCGSRSIHSIFNRMEGFFYKAKAYNWQVVEIFSLSVKLVLDKQNILEGVKMTPDATGIFLTNEDASLAYLELVREGEIPAGTLHGVSYDLTPAIAEAIRDGILEGTIYQDPAALGRTSVHKLLTQFHHQPQAGMVVDPEDIHIPVQKITRENLQTYLPTTLEKADLVAMKK